MSVVSLARIAGVVGRVVGADRWRHRAVREDPFVECEQIVGARTHEHDVDETLAGVLTNEVAVFLERACAGCGTPDRVVHAGRGDAVCHVCVLRISEDEVIG